MNSLRRVLRLGNPASSLKTVLCSLGADGLLEISGKHPAPLLRLCGHPWSLPARGASPGCSILGLLGSQNRPEYMVNCLVPKPEPPPRPTPGPRGAVQLCSVETKIKNFLAPNHPGPSRSARHPCFQPPCPLCGRGRRGSSQEQEGHSCRNAGATTAQSTMGLQ